mmetsp:Transcript_23601/g.58358  ORF Transcript_23601/g.58358 Transcript_23601/m.58358 type:complete len:102 (+) Transcript_23601:472-777(+)
MPTDRYSCCSDSRMVRCPGQSVANRYEMTPPTDSRAVTTHPRTADPPASLAHRGTGRRTNTSQAASSRDCSAVFALPPDELADRAEQGLRNDDEPPSPDRH